MVRTTWWDLESGGVLELDAPASVPALELHWREVDGRTVAWWLDERGRWWGRAHVGLG
jgi:hypothetical protein